ncbi:MAG: preprotein translocase subunit SecY [Planctomycetaceae bacterium]|jgi:preprotein translocase subunit SecY|nr:preprotein translocase subunit SecY [Planctomycetaceae bacterium]
MFQKIRIIFSIAELRQKIFLTLALLAIYRVGWAIPLPIVDAQKFSDVLSANAGMTDVLNRIAVFSGSQFTQMTIFGLGIMPYISASIIFQLLGTVIPKLAELQKEGESGRRKINEYTRYATIPICMIQSYFMIKALEHLSLFNTSLAPGGNLPFYWTIAMVLVMTTGTAFLMWLGEQIDEYGIGNGISLLIMAGILARAPEALRDIINGVTSSGGLQLGGDMGVDRILILCAMFVGVVVGVVFITKGQRRIPTQSAKHFRGNRMYGGGNRQYLPLKINQAGVMPIIFASSLLLFPNVFFVWLAKQYPSVAMWSTLQHIFERGHSYIYLMLYILLIFFFCYFWTAITFNPKDMADNLKNHGTFIPGYRPGRWTADFLEKVMIYITYVGAAFLAIIAITPNVVSETMSVTFAVSSFFGGTSLLIAVSVAIDLIDKIDSHLIMRNYKGLLDKRG